MKILTVKEYIAQQKEYLEELTSDVLSEKLTKAFAALLASLHCEQITFNPNLPKTYTIKLGVEINPKKCYLPEVASKIYTELIMIMESEGTKQISVAGLTVTPMLIDIYDNNTPKRGVLVHYMFIS